MWPGQYLEAPSIAKVKSMDKTAPTLELRDIHLPMEPGYWPLAPGWWLLIVLVLILGYLLLKKLAKIRQAKRLNNLMQQELMSLRESYKKHNDKHLLAIDVSNLLNRFVVHY